MAELKVGSKAPDFTLESGDGEEVKLSSFKGKQVVLYFYPRDNTPGCTREAMAFRDGIQKIRKKGGVVLGVSTDTTASHRKFAEKCDLNFPLLADTENKVADKYGVWQERKNYGKSYMGIVRSTFIVGKDGKIKKIFPNVKVDGHFDEVLAALG